MGQNFIDQTDSNPSTNPLVAFAESVSSSSSGGNNTPIYLHPASVGFLALLMAMVNNAEAVQDLVANGEMSLSEQVSKETQSYSTAWLTQMSNANGSGNPPSSTAPGTNPGTDPGDTWLLAYYKANGAWPQDPPRSQRSKQHVLV